MGSAIKLEQVRVVIVAEIDFFFETLQFELAHFFTSPPHYFVPQKVLELAREARSR